MTADDLAVIRRLLVELRESLLQEIDAVFGDRLLSISEAAEIAGTSQAGMYKRIARGHVVASRHGGRLMVRRSDLLRADPKRRGFRA